MINLNTKELLSLDYREYFYLFLIGFGVGLSWFLALFLVEDENKFSLIFQDHLTTILVLILFFLLGSLMLYLLHQLSFLLARRIFNPEKFIKKKNKTWLENELDNKQSWYRSINQGYFHHAPPDFLKQYYIEGSYLLNLLSIFFLTSSIILIVPLERVGCFFSNIQLWTMVIIVLSLGCGIQMFYWKNTREFFFYNALLNKHLIYSHDNKKSWNRWERNNVKKQEKNNRSRFEFYQKLINHLLEMAIESMRIGLSKTFNHSDNQYENPILLALKISLR